MMVDRSKAPAFQIPENISLIPPTKQILGNGIPVFYIHTPHIEAVKVEVTTSVNTRRSLSKALVPFFTLHMLLEGTGEMASHELDHFFDHYASEVDVVSNFEQNGLSLLTTRKHFSEVLPVFRSLFTEAIFPEKELAKRKSQKELSISLNRDQTSARANQLYRKGLFGEEHLFGFVAEEDDVRKVDRQDLKDFYDHDFLVRPEVFVTGNLASGQLEDIERLFSDLQIIPEGEQMPFRTTL